MNELTFQVEFLSDIVLPASSNTEGNIEELDFIPGSNFLGMVAQKYGDFEERAFDVFHSGKVRFGDATLLVDGIERYKMPFSFFHPKLNEKEIYQHQFLTEDKGQLKQMRKGYIDPNISDGLLKVDYVDYNYAQKSAYDSVKRRSKSSSMYGYKAIASGSKWQFTLKYDDSINEKYINLIQEILEKSKRLGKSKSSQYGQIKISRAGTYSNLSNPNNNTEVVLYVNSRLALIDKNGNATYDLRCLVDGLSEANIVYDKCQIRTSTFTPYNGAMQTKTYERLVIAKGSVIVLQGLNAMQVEALQQRVGLYLAEGFGELFVNPPFLMDYGKLKLIERDNDSNRKDERVLIDIENLKTKTVKFLGHRHNRDIKRLALANEVYSFILSHKTLYKNIKNSQWGTIRSICTVGQKRFLEDIASYISSGKVSWTKIQIDTLLPEKSYSLEFIKLVAMQMPKEGDK